eukprot:GGOE01040483.1.p1 GENE.GGOE01040483.1~~GGOE01040483.1.p1  ORF type:complete len:240 (+),score=66.20 GGOE01040483.1:29-748(+)
MAWDAPPLRKAERRHIRIVEFPGKGRGVLAAKVLLADTVVMRAYPYVLRGGQRDVWTDVILKMVQRRVDDRNAYFDRVVMTLSDNETPDYGSVDDSLIAAAQAIDPTLSELTVRRLASVFWHNCFPEGLFPDAALFNHSCAPNCTYAVDWDADSAFTIRTTRAVARGEELCLNYLATTGAPYDVRQATLYHGWQFHCDCTLCITEQQRRLGGTKGQPRARGVAPPAAPQTQTPAPLLTP